jgi:uncharacterized protein (TIGR01777 family)
MRIGLTGASGLIGREIIRQARNQQNAVVAFSRNRDRTISGSAQVRAFGPEMDLSGLDALIHLAGEPIIGLWTAAKQRRILDSRVQGTRWLVESAIRAKQPPSVLVSASGINIYGNRGDEHLPESAAIGNSGFLRNVAVAWEQEAQRAHSAGVRVVCVRIAMVLGKEAGALPLMARVFRFGGGGRLGTGRQWMPWIHIRDVAALFLHAARTELLKGPINGCAPNPVRNADFTRILGKIVRRPTIFPVPAFILRAALRNESSLLLDSLRVIPERALQSGFEFRFPELYAALADALGER